MRRVLYHVLSSFFLNPPDREIIALLIKPDMMEDLEEILGRDSIALLRKFSEKFKGNYEELKGAYKDLFVIPVDKYVKPYESAYRDLRRTGHKKLQGQLMGPSAVAVKKFYKKAGADIDGIKELPDHIGVELECMHFLCQREEIYWKKNSEENAACMLRLQKTFLLEHLYQWVGNLCENILKKSNNDFYRALAELTSNFIQLDYNMLKHTIE